MMETTIQSPIGWLRLCEEDGALCLIAKAEGPYAETQEESALLREASAQLEAYFAGDRQEFSIPIAPCGTAFENAVWQALKEIPFGQTRTYAQIAARIGKPSAARAVGHACGRNPILVMIPCHRVVGSDGRLTGFAAGLAAKRTLLSLEGINIKE